MCTSRHNSLLNWLINCTTFTFNTFNSLSEVGLGIFDILDVSTITHTSYTSERLFLHCLIDVNFMSSIAVGRDSAGGIATRYGLDGRGIESR